MRDEQQRRLLFALDLHQQIGDGRLNRDIQRRNRFVRDHDARISCKGPRNADPLFLPTRELAWHPVGKGAWQLDQIQKLQHPLFAICLGGSDAKDLQRALDLTPHGHGRVQRVKGVLEHHLHV